MKVGDPYPIWFNDKATVLAVEPYRGSYPQWFTHVLRLSTKPSATTRGWLEVAVKLEGE